jgi:predicted nucleotidyltransferase
MKTLDEIKQIVAQNKDELRRRYKVREVGVFGSYVRGNQKKGSDIDILVDFDGPVSLLKLVSLENHLADIIGASVDVIPKEDVRPELKQTILREVVYL